MEYEKWVLSCSFIFTLFIGLTTAQPNIIASYCYPTGNYTTNSPYQTNLNSVLSSLSTKPSIPYGFYNLSSGRDSNRVSVIGLCRGDVVPESCGSCLNQSVDNLREVCPNQKEAIQWSDECMLRYSNRSIFRSNQTIPGFYLYNINNASNPTQFNMDVRNLLENLRDVAAAGGSMLKYATGNMTGEMNSIIYGLVQCTPDLSTTQCSDCLDRAFSFLPQCCDGKVGGRILTPSCNFRYETYRFYNQTFLTAGAPRPQPNAPAPQPYALTPPPSFSPPMQPEAPSPSSGTTPPTETTAHAPPPSFSPPMQPRAPSPSSGTTPPTETTAHAPPPLGNGGTTKLVASISVSTLMAAVAAIFVF